MLEEMGIIGILMIIIILIFVPLICTVILGVTFANMLGFTGLSWWAFVVMFYIILMGLLGLINR